ncbi:MAG: PQQ-dependent sugar dehydrogenase [Gemmataceae bacterium]|nr:PQQ-dependent sugar dehydrogenase [Gemmataceae bacterium]
MIRCFMLRLALIALAASELAAAEPLKNPEAERAMRQFRLPSGFVTRLWACEPLLHNPVCFAFNEKGECFVAETYRLHRGVTDNRGHMYWLDDDIASRTVEDRVAMHKKHAKDKFSEIYERYEDRVKKVWDSDSDGIADQSSIFADGFKTAASGIGSGLLARGGSVWYANIPDLWLLRDTHGKHRADVRESLHYGYGVHVAFLGHDLHGVVMGPDGRIYFSIGDRGLNVRSREGRQLENPDSGAVLRCEPDGSRLELVHFGLRNPQELAFDNFGNLFTVDNNSDSGDKARLVQVVEGGDSGWRMYYQYGSRLGDRGPWNAEKLWHLRPDNTAAYIVPPLAHLSDGPSGLTFHPGVAAVPEKFADHFFLADFRGGADNSGIWAFSVKPKGASFELNRPEQFIWRVLATDCDFGPDGAFYICDWIQGWEQPGKGRIYRFTHPEWEQRPQLVEVRKLLAEGFRSRSTDELLKLLEHADRRVRLEAQFALAERAMPGPSPDAQQDAATRGLTRLAVHQAQSPPERQARVHALWALGQIARRSMSQAQSVREEVMSAIKTAAGDHDSEIRAQAYRVLGESPLEPLAFAPALSDAEPRVRFQAALALARRLAEVPAAGDARDKLRTAVLDLLRASAGEDMYLRHAAVQALSRLEPQIGLDWAKEPPAVRQAIIVALRRNVPERQAVEQLTAALTDPDPQVVLEAARALHDDQPNPPALAALARLVMSRQLPVPVLYRALNAHFRLGGRENAEAIAEFAAATTSPEALRVEAVAMLGDWANPSKRDRVTNEWRPLPNRDPAVAAAAFRSRLGALFTGPESLRREASKVAAKLGVREVASTLRQIVSDGTATVQSRIEALRALQRLNDSELDQVLTAARKSQAAELRAEALTLAATRHPDQAVPQLAEVLNHGEIVEKQAALAALAQLRRAEADAILLDWAQRLSRGEVAPELRLDVREAAAARNTPELAQAIQALERTRPADDALWRYRDALVGGNAAKGREILLHKAEVTCIKCHKLHGVGGEVGPELAGIGGKQSRQYILESIVFPDKEIAKGYDSVVLDLANGKTVTGVLRGEDDKTIKIVTAEAEVLTIDKSEVDDRRRGVSAMPDDLVKKLSLRELRDLVEFLASLKDGPPAK